MFCSWGMKRNLPAKIDTKPEGVWRLRVIRTGRRVESNTFSFRDGIRLVCARAADFSVHEVAGDAGEPASIAEARTAPGPARDGRPVDELRGPFLTLARTYVVRGLDDGFEIVDQHALHERVTYEALLGQLAQGRVEVQRELVPELVELARSEVALLGERTEALAAIGIELAVFGPTTIAVRGLPTLLERRDAARIVRDLVGLFERGGEAPSAAELLAEVLHSMACRASVMAGDELDESEIRSLLERAAALEHHQTCPHGRPTRVRFTLADLERAFHRR